MAQRIQHMTITVDKADAYRYVAGRLADVGAELTAMADEIDAYAEGMRLAAAASHIAVRLREIATDYGTTARDVEAAATASTVSVPVDLSGA